MKYGPLLSDQKPTTLKITPMEFLIYMSNNHILFCFNLKFKSILT